VSGWRRALDAGHGLRICDAMRVMTRRGECACLTGWWYKGDGDGIACDAMRCGWAAEGFRELQGWRMEMEGLCNSVVLYVRACIEALRVQRRI
jgi:hypothetical protein